MAGTLYGPVAEDLGAVEEVIAETAQVGYPVLASLLGHILQTRGKRLRPALVLLAAGFHDYPLERLKRLAAAIELLHTATLIHDDMVDGAATRRGVPTLHHLVDGRATILVGDYLFARAAVLCSQTDNVRVMNVFGQTLMTICEGELRQMFGASDWHQGIDDYYRRIDSKTASLFRTATETGAILSGAPEPAIAALRQYGLSLGMAFQIVDDVLDFVGDERKLGKPVGGDLRQRIITLPTLWALEHYPEDRTIRDVFESEDDAEEAVRRAVEMIVASPAIDYSMGVARAFCEQARGAVLTLPDTPHRRALLDIADYVVARSS